MAVQSIQVVEEELDLIQNIVVVEAVGNCLVVAVEEEDTDSPLVVAVLHHNNHLEVEEVTVVAVVDKKHKDFEEHHHKTPDFDLNSSKQDAELLLPPVLPQHSSIAAAYHLSAPF